MIHLVNLSPMSEHPLRAGPGRVRTEAEARPRLEALQAARRDSIHREGVTNGVRRPGALLTVDARRGAMDTGDRVGPLRVGRAARELRGGRRHCV